MAYGLKYICEFDRLAVTYPRYRVEIYQKDYEESYETEITGGASVVVHSYDTDDPISPIKGSSIEVRLINESGSISLQDLYSEDDEEFKIKLIWEGPTELTLFEGFVVQDDSSELMVDYNHEITISANDNLGLLKDVPFNRAAFQENYLELNAEFVDVEGVAPHTLVITDLDQIIEPGDVISTTGTLSGVYHVTSVAGDNYTVEETITTAAAETVTLIVFRADFYTLRSLLSFIKSCLGGTGLNLNTHIYTNLNESTQDDTVCFLEQTLVDPQILNSGNNQWDDCYTVLEKILKRFGLTLFQAKGVWNIVRLAELRYNDYNIPGFIYDSDFALDSTTIYEDGFGKFLIGIGELTQAETGLTERITRPHKFVKETFNYQQPNNLLRNFDLSQLGDFITSYADGSNTNYEYELPWWTVIPGTFVTAATFYIRIVKDALDNELARYIVIKDGDIESFGIPVGSGDSFTFSFSVITNQTKPGNFNIIFEVKVTDGTTTRYLKEDGLWYSTRGYTINVLSGDNGDQRHSYDITGTEIPFDGILTFSLADYFTGTTEETHYSDIRVEYTPMINESTKIIGHTHTSEKTVHTKNKSEYDLSIDTSPRNSIAGTLFLDSVTNLLQDRAVNWTRKGETEERKLGDIITFENLFLRKEARTLLEGTFHGLLSSENNHLSLLSLIHYTLFTTRNFIFGRLEIDYRNNLATGTLYEMYKDTDTDSDLNEIYTFQYLYDPK